MKDNKIMGAFYDVIVAHSQAVDDLVNKVQRFVESLQRRVICCSDLQSLRTNDASAVIISPSHNGFTQIIANAYGLGISGIKWYHANPLAIWLSSSLDPVAHFWTLDSGLVAGYALYSHSQKSECGTVFYTRASHQDQLMDDVPVPANLSGDRLRALLNTTLDFSSLVQSGRNLEEGLASIIERFGFEVQLVDINDALDEKIGMQVEVGNCKEVPLVGWKAVMFAS